MHVKKFEADSVEEALKDIKRTLGPEAIILKTVTNKGLKGTFKRKKIEITAAISEQKYIDKASVDHVLDSKQKDLFYNDRASSISDSINRYASTSKTNGYGGLSLNKRVNTVKTSEQVPAANVSANNELDDFLNSDDNFSSEEFVSEQEIQREATRPAFQEQLAVQDVNRLSARIKMLEDSLANQISSRTSSRESELRDLRNLLASFGIAESSIKKLIKKVTFEFSPEDMEDESKIFDFVLREMSSSIKTEMPLFSRVDSSAGPVVTVLVSDCASGQTSMAMKLASMNDKTVVIQSGTILNGVSDVAVKVVQDIFAIEVVKTNGISEIIHECRKAVDAGKSVVIDYRNSVAEEESTRKFSETLIRAFSNVEVLLTLSSVHSENYNMRMLEKYRVISDGIVITNLDNCLDYGALFNLAIKAQGIPYKFYGTGRNIPDDVESATPERLIAGIFKL